MLLVLAMTSQVLGAEEEQAQVLYNRDVRPILSNNCFKCHGPDGEARQAELRLDHSKSAQAVLSANNPSKSKLLKRILSSDPDVQMPPPDSKLALTEAEKEILSRWVKQGGSYQQHWAFEPILKAPIPKVKQTTWPQHAIDHFVLARMEQDQPAALPRPPHANNCCDD